MKARHILLLFSIVFFTALISLDMCSAKSQRYFHSEANGYSFIIPKGWKQIPDEVVRQLYNKALSVKARTMILHEAEFQLETEDTWFHGPTILVQVAKYSKLGLSRPPREDEFGDIIKSITGKDVMKAKEKVYSKDVQNLISGANIGKASINKENRRYTFVSEVISDDSSNFKSEVVGYFGKEAIVQLSFNDDAESDWSQFEADRNLVFGSFRFDPLMAYRAPPFDPSIVYRTPPKRQTFWEELLVDLGVYGILAVVVMAVGVLAVIFKSKVRPEHKDENSLKQEQPDIEKDNQEQ